jgi:arsenate reductase
MKERGAMQFICYPKCTTCQKARNWLDEHGVQYKVRDIKAENPSYDELKTWIAASGLPIRKFFNTSGLLYKSLNLKDKLPAMNEEECLKLLSTDGMLVKRPLLMGNGITLVGFKEADWGKNLAGVDRI